MVVLAIVGSTKFTNPNSLVEAERLIRAAIINLQPTKVVSGGALGIDSLGVKIAKELGIPTEEFLPQNARWEPDGYKDRNLKIAANCTHLLRIVDKTSKTYGSGWTRDQATRLGKETLSYDL